MIQAQATQGDMKKLIPQPPGLPSYITNRKKYHMLELQSGGREYVFQASSLKELDLWHKALAETVGSNQDNRLIKATQQSIARIERQMARRD